MSNWVYHLNLKDLWEKRDKNTISVQELGKQVANRIRKLSCFKKYERELEDITTKFEFSERVDEIMNMPKLKILTVDKLQQMRTEYRDKIKQIEDRMAER